MTELLNQVTAIVKTFERPKSLDLLIRSIRRYYPELRVIVGDDSFVPYPRSDVVYRRLDPDMGASAGRNVLLSEVETPYFLQLDDDFEFTPDTRIERLAEIVAAGDAELAGGDVVNCRPRWLLPPRRKPVRYHGLISVCGDHVRFERGYRAQGVGYGVCDIVVQFFVARCDSIRGCGGWDSELKTEEHEEFFFRLQQHGVLVAHCPSVTVWHWCARPARYAPFRGRPYRPLAAAKMGMTRWTDMDGNTVTFPSSTARSINVNSA